MSKFKFTSVRYCTLLGRNVVFESCYNDDGQSSCECLNKSLCGFEECGCRNRLSNTWRMTAFSGSDGRVAQAKM